MSVAVQENCACLDYTTTHVRVMPAYNSCPSCESNVCSVKGCTPCRRQTNFLRRAWRVLCESEQVITHLDEIAVDLRGG